MGDTIRITAPSRLHFGLISLTSTSARAYGGCGLSIWHEPVIVQANRTHTDLVTLEGASEEIHSYLCDMLSRHCVSGLSIEFLQTPSHHVGLGSKTACAMAVAETVSRLFSLDLAEHEIMRMSGRGGASGIGINAYFYGGFVLDGGQRSAQRSDFLPSSSSTKHALARPLIRLAWPDEWSIHLFHFTDATGFSGERERQFFREHSPMPRVESAQVAMALAFELPASIIDRDFDGLRASLRASRGFGFKVKEIANSPLSDALLTLIDSDPSLAGTMSSFGPTVVVFAQNDQLRSHTDLLRFARDNAIDVSRAHVSRGRIVETIS